MQHSATAPDRAPVIEKFLRGTVSGALSSTLMMGLFAGVMLGMKALGIAAAASFALPAFLPTAGAMVLCAGLFSGIMGSVRAVREVHYDRSQLRHAEIHAASRGVAPILMPMPVPAMAADAAPELAGETTPRRWTDRTGAGSTNQISEILARGSMSDKDRASAILAARAAPAAETSR